MRAVIDRAEGGLLVLELDDGTFVNVPAASAPANAREGTVVEYADGRVVSVDEEATAARAARLRARLERLKKR